MVVQFLDPAAHVREHTQIWCSRLLTQGVSWVDREMVIITHAVQCDALFGIGFVRLFGGKPIQAGFAQRCASE